MQVAQVRLVVIKEGWEISMVCINFNVEFAFASFLIQERHSQSDIRRGVGGRVEELEGPEILADEFKQPGEMCSMGHSRAAEDILYSMYDHKLKELKASYFNYFNLYTYRVIFTREKMFYCVLTIKELGQERRSCSPPIYLK